MKTYNKEELDNQWLNDFDPETLYHAAWKRFQENIIKRRECLHSVIFPMSTGSIGYPMNELIQGFQPIVKNI